MGYNLNFLSNNVNRLNSSKKRIKMFEYFREKIANNGILFLQETHSSHDTVINWRGDFKSKLFFSHGTTNSCCVMIRYLGSNKLKLIEQKMIIKVEFSLWMLMPMKKHLF